MHGEAEAAVKPSKTGVVTRVKKLKKRSTAAKDGVFSKKATGGRASKKAAPAGGGGTGAAKPRRSAGFRVSKLVSIPPRQYPSANVERDKITDLDDYLPGATTVEIVERFSTGLRGGKSGRMISVTGPYGSGKSTMAVFLKGLVAPHKSAEYKASAKVLRKHSASAAAGLIYARKKAGAHGGGMIRCPVMARREPISATITRALHRGATERFGRYAKKFEGADLLQRAADGLEKGLVPEPAEITRIVDGMCRAAPVMIMIDEFGKNIDHSAEDNTKEADLFLLQELAEMSRRGTGVQLSMVTFQHMAFEEYAAGSPAADRKEWAKIQGRFEDVYFANLAEQTWQLVSKAICQGGDRGKKKIQAWADGEAKAMEDLGMYEGPKADLIASCYPLSPLALRILPDLCAKYGQHERTLLSFLSDRGMNTVSTFIAEGTYEKGRLPSVGLDMLYDYFIKDISMIHASSANISRMMEIATTIRDAHGLGDAETMVLKTIGVLNLVGESGRVRASRQLLDHALGGDAGAAIESLEKKSIITYRKNPDEYRIWRGTDVDIAARIDAALKRYRGASLTAMLEEEMELHPCIAGKHSYVTGTTRCFKRQIATGKTDREDYYDGIIVYDPDGAGKGIPKSIEGRPVIVFTPGDTADLRKAAIEAAALRDILENDEEVKNDRVASSEIRERMWDAKDRLKLEFITAFEEHGQWYYYKNDRQVKGRDEIAPHLSKICDRMYNKTPIIWNEIINKREPSRQGMSGKRRFFEAMLSNTDKPRFGIEGYGPERLIYESTVFKNKIHAQGKNAEWGVQDPTGDVRHVWDAILEVLKGSKDRVPLSEIYGVCKMPPYGIREGVLDVFVIAVIFVHRENIALYEHGTYVPKLTIEVVERMMKNVEFFDAKYFKPTESRRKMLDAVAASLGTEGNRSVIGIVSHLVRRLSPLPAYTRKTKNVSDGAQAVREAILGATEPDTMLFKSLPEAVGISVGGSRITAVEIRRFARGLSDAVEELQSEMPRTLGEIKAQLLEGTGMASRGDLSKAAAAMSPAVSDRAMKVFLTALATDALENDEDWINYVAMSIAETTPAEWTDSQRAMFGNLLDDMTDRFRNLAALRSSSVSEDLRRPSLRVTITRSDGSERRSLVIEDPERARKMEGVADAAARELKKRGFSERDMDALIAVLAKRGGRPQDRDRAGGGP